MPDRKMGAGGDAEIDYEAIERARPKLTNKEVERRRQGPTYSTDEVIKYLQNLDCIATVVPPRP